MAYKRFNVYKTMMVSSLVIWLALRYQQLPIQKETKLSLGYPQKSLMNFTELANAYGYESEEHIVETEDGYLLTVFRMRAPGKERGTPTLLMHGLLQSADSFADAGPAAGLAYLLADAGHDLWLGNVRGNYYSRAHTRLQPEDTAFWNFCVDEIGRYDVPAMVDYVLQQTATSKLNYIGYSQGAGAYIIMCSERPDYCNKAQVMIGLAPAARQLNTSSRLYKLLTTTLMKMEWFLTSTGVVELFSKGSLSQEFVAFFCQLNHITDKLCATGMNMFDSVDSLHPGSVTNETTRTLFGHFPAGTSLHNMAWYGQVMNTDRYGKFDYGKERNLALYGTAFPPDYNLTAVTVPVVAIYGRNDGLVDTKDVEWLLARLPNVLEAVVVKDPRWNHLDVTYSQYTGEMIFPKINEYLLKYSSS
ncbi:lipase 1-like [Manduca sexta]|uniref:Lipase n=1 Tax=Manduca sexta TaxID=7130 RepID=A0A921YQN5_MANSE|nr:lipase 1-like [Manduca sexta]KAG6443682.1 hypothetical protein O3G_MSEX002962 [Manduca sexta]